MNLGKLWKEKWVDVSGTLGKGDTAPDSWNALIASRVELDRFLISVGFISHATRRNVRDPEGNQIVIVLCLQKTDRSAVLPKGDHP